MEIKVKREEILNKAFEEYLSKNISFAMTDILDKYKEHFFDYLEKYLWDFNKVFQRGVEEQASGKKGNIEYICIYFLYSSVQSKTYETQINLYDEKGFFDKDPVTGSMVSDIFSVYFSNEWELYCEYMNKSVIQIKKQELFRYRIKLIDKYKKFLGEILKMYMPYIMNLKSYALLNKSGDIHIYYGEYIGNLEKVNAEGAF